MKCSYCQKELICELTVIDLLFYPNFPRRCHDCQELFLLKKEASCPKCGRFGSGQCCSDCLAWQKQYPGHTFSNRALFAYDEQFKEWIYRYKYLGDYQIRGAFAFELRQVLKKYPKHLICPLPLSEKRFYERGFNQVSACLKAAQIPFEEVLQRKHLPPQAKKTKKERLEMSQPFMLACPKIQLKGRDILLVDDVYTTGRTLFYAMEVFQECSVGTISAVTFAR